VPDAILWDRHKQSLVYVVRLTGELNTRLVVELDTSVKAGDQADKRQKVKTNAITNSQVVDAEVLKDTGRYELINGSI
jgi:hypothetical protein